MLTNEREIQATEPRLRRDEMLVQDGAGKLMLCWVAWTLAQRWQCDQTASAEKPWRQTAKRLFDRLCRTANGRGFGQGTVTSNALFAGIGSILSEAAVKDVSSLQTAAPLIEVEKRLGVLFRA